MMKFIMAWMSFYVVFLIIGMVMDGVLISNANASDLNTGIQFSVLRNPLENTSANPLSWFGAAIDYLKAWAGLLTLDFALFSGAAEFIRWGFLAVGAVPIGAELVSRVFGR